MYPLFLFHGETPNLYCRHYPGTLVNRINWVRALDATYLTGPRPGTTLSLSICDVRLNDMDLGHHRHY